MVEPVPGNPGPGDALSTSRVHSASLGGQEWRRLAITLVPVAGERVTLRRVGRSGSADAGASSTARRIVSIAIRISSWAKAAPMQRRVPPPNGIQE